MRKLFLCAAIPVFLLAGCANLPKITFPTLTLPTVQAQVSAIVAGIDDAATLAETDAGLSSTIVTEIKTDITAFNTTALSFTSLSTPTNAFADAAAFSKAAEGIVAILPIDPATKAAIELGLAIVNAFASGQTTSPVATTTTTTASIMDGLTFKAMPIVAIPAPKLVPAS